MEDPIKESFDQLIQQVSMSYFDTESRVPEVARVKLSAKLAAAQVNAMEGFKAAMEASARQSDAVNRVLVRLNTILVRLTWLLVIVGVVAVLITFFGTNHYVP